MKLRRLVVMLGLGLGLGWAAAGCAPGATSPVEGIYVAGPDGTAVVRIASDPTEAAWSPDSSRLAYAGADGVWVVAVDGSDRRRVSEVREAAPPSWSPDGGRLAFVDPGERRLVVQPVDGGTASFYPLLPQADSDPNAAFPIRNVPAWSPDGKQIAFVSWDGNGDEVFVLDLGTGTRRQVTFTRPSAEGIDPEVPGSPRKAQSNAGAPAWSPEGTWIALALYPETGGAQGGVYLASPAGTGSRRVVGMSPGWGPLWSPDASLLLFTLRREDRQDLFTSRPDRWGLTNLTSRLSAPVESAAWAPDGDRIVLAAGGDLYVMDRLTGETTRIVETPSRESWPVWSPDGQHIAFARSTVLIDGR